MRKPVKPSETVTPAGDMPDWRSEALSAAKNAVDMAALGESCVLELRSILHAIFKLTGDQDLAHNLARVGYDLANERHGMLESNLEEMEQYLADLKGGGNE